MNGTGGRRLLLQVAQDPLRRRDYGAHVVAQDVEVVGPAGDVGDGVGGGVHAEVAGDDVGDRLGFDLGGAESYPGVFRDFGGFADDAIIANGYISLSDRPGIGFEGQARLYKIMRELAA